MKTCSSVVPLQLISNPERTLASGDVLTCSVDATSPYVTSLSFSCTSPQHADQPDEVEGSKTVSKFTFNNPLDDDGNMNCSCSVWWGTRTDLYAHMLEVFQIQCKCVWRGGGVGGVRVERGV